MHNHLGLIRCRRDRSTIVHGSAVTLRATKSYSRDQASRSNFSQWPHMCRISYRDELTGCCFSYRSSPEVEDYFASSGRRLLEDCWKNHDPLGFQPHGEKRKKPTRRTLSITRKLFRQQTMVVRESNEESKLYSSTNVGESSR